VIIPGGFDELKRATAKWYSELDLEAPSHNCSRMAKNSRISPSEWRVLEVLWDHHPATTREVVDRLGPDSGWHPKTILTFLKRLVDKGFVHLKKDGRLNLYSPATNREECVVGESENFMKRVMTKLSAPALIHFIENAELSDDEIDQLEATLRERRKSGDA